MKEEMNKEMDLLLRRLSRRQDSSISNGDASIAGEHLDADELSSYAENALPAAARARYTEHLAECSGCRELIVQLSSSIGVVASEQTARVPGPSSLKNFLASLFSPMVLRYAIPALGIFVVAVIGFFSLRQERGSDVAQQANAPAAVSNANVHFNNYQSGQVGRLSSDDKNTSPAVKADSDSQAKPSYDEAIPAPPNAPPVVDLRAEVSKDAEAKKAEDQQKVTDFGYAPPKPAPSVATEEVNKTANEPPKEVSQRAVNELPVSQPSKPSELSKSKDRREREGAGAGAGARTESTNAGRSTTDSTAAPAGSMAVRSAPADRIQRDGVDESEKAEIRSVAGRRFRKQGIRWIDTAFNSGASTVSVSRGSEQFRALVADEPGIKTIADQLDGEIIVVWKGRAYRIR